MSLTMIQGLLWIGTGGPTDEDTVEDFIRDMMSDKQVMPLPWPVRKLVARRIARRRREAALARYRLIGLPSPVLAAHKRQALALEAELGDGWLVESAFLYSRPNVKEAWTRLLQRGARKIYCLPAFPQWSRATSGSALAAVRRAARKVKILWRPLGSFPSLPGFIEMLSADARPHLARATALVFTAHSLPKFMADRGDPYPRQVEETARALGRALNRDDWKLAYQSRGGSGRWLGPEVEEILRCLRQQGHQSVLIVPLSFVWENLETLVDLDKETRELALDLGLSDFIRARLQECHPLFIADLARMIKSVSEGQSGGALDVPGRC
jgi:ferrochelatase